MKKSALAVIGALVFAGNVYAQAKVEMHVVAQKQVYVTENGQQVMKTVGAKDIQPGETLIYTIEYTNKGDQVAKNVSIDDAVPAGTLYIDGSAQGANSVVLFSIDNGKTFKKPTLLSYEITDNNGKVERRIASPDQYTAVRWVVKSVKPGESGKVSFKVRVK